MLAHDVATQAAWRIMLCALCVASRSKLSRTVAIVTGCGIKVAARASLHVATPLRGVICTTGVINTVQVKCASHLFSESHIAMSSQGGTSNTWCTCCPALQDLSCILVTVKRYRAGHAYGH